MDKRGQIYILAAVLLCIAIYGVMKVTNRLEMPAETNFDFYVENFKGERSYVYDLGFVGGGGSSDDLLDIFTNFGSGTGIIYAEYKDDAWTIANYLGKDIFINDDKGERVAIPSGDVPAGKLTFGLGKVYIVSQTQLIEVGINNKRTLNNDNIEIAFDGSTYTFTKPSNGDKVESILFQNIDKNYIKVVRV